LAITPVGDEARAQLPGAGLGEGVSGSDRDDGGLFELRADAAGLAASVQRVGGAENERVGGAGVRGADVREVDAGGEDVGAGAPGGEQRRGARNRGCRGRGGEHGGAERGGGVADVAGFADGVLGEPGGRDGQAADLVLAGGRVVPAFGFGGAVVVCVFCGSGFRPKQCRCSRRSRGSWWDGWARVRRVGCGPGRGGPAWRRPRAARRRWSGEGRGKLIGDGAAKGRQYGGGRSRKMPRGCDSRMAARGASRFVEDRGKRTGGKARARWQGLSRPYRRDEKLRCAPARRFPICIPPRGD
jgi:hypothetical protein